VRARTVQQSAKICDGTSANLRYRSGKKHTYIMHQQETIFPLRWETANRLDEAGLIAEMRRGVGTNLRDFSNRLGTSAR
jgi:hypothetical protein